MAIPSDANNQDGDAVPDYLDLDSDDDGLTDAREAGGSGRRRRWVTRWMRQHHTGRRLVRWSVTELTAEHRRRLRRRRRIYRTTSILTPTPMESMTPTKPSTLDDDQIGDVVAVSQ